MNLMNLFDKELGAKLRALIAVVFALVTAAVAVLQAVADVLESLPKWREIGVVLMWVHAAITLLGRFSAIGDRTPPPAG